MQVTNSKHPKGRKSYPNPVSTLSMKSPNPGQTTACSNLNDLKSEKPDLYSSFLSSCVVTLSQYDWISHISSEEYAQELFRCLVLKASVSDPKSYSLPAKLDMGWHALILETQDYVHLCQFITGTPDGMIHHSTRTANDTQALKNWRVNNLKKHYAEAFGNHLKSWCWNEYPIDRNVLTSQAPKPVGSREQKQSLGAVIYVKTLTGKTILVPYNGTDSVVSFKRKVWQDEGIPIDQQRLIYQGKQLENHRMLFDYNIQEGATLYLILRVIGC